MAYPSDGFVYPLFAVGYTNEVNTVVNRLGLRQRGVFVVFLHRLIQLPYNPIIIGISWQICVVKDIDVQVEPTDSLLWICIKNHEQQRNFPKIGPLFYMGVFQ